MSTEKFSNAAFKAYDIRGRVPEELNDILAYRIGRAYAQMFRAKRVAVGRDIRLTSAALCCALTEGLTDGGCDVIDIGVCGTEMIYFATFSLGLDGGVMVTASHNPRDYNGMKLVRAEARPISGDSGLRDIQALAVGGVFEPTAGSKGVVTEADVLPAYIEHLLTYVDRAALRPLKVVVNAGNGCAGPVLDALAEFLPIEFIRVHHEPDGTFPNGIPNPLLPENRASTSMAVLEHHADAGIAWDGDFDRCFLFDEQGRFLEGYYIVGLLAEAMLKRNPGAKIIHDPRLVWNTIELTRRDGGIPVQSKTGHAFIKERMRSEDAVYGGEMSAHHYFRKFAYCDSGMIPWLLILEIMSREARPLSALLEEPMARYPVSGEINKTVKNSARLLALAEERFGAASAIDRTDGVSFEFDAWRFNLRTSNTEPVVRLNVETRGDDALLREKTAMLLEFIDQNSN